MGGLRAAGLRLRAAAKDTTARRCALLLTASALCTAALLAGAGGNAAQVFLFSGAAPAAQPTPEPGPLSGLVVAVDAGHGGYDGGAVGRVSGVAEKTLNLDVALRTARLLEAQGAGVVLTRAEDIALCDENPPIRRKLQDMQRRAAIISGGGADLVLSIHMNEYAGRSESGPQVFYREGCPAGRLLAGALQEAMIGGLQPRTQRAALGGDYYILTLGVPSALVECGFLSNREEEALLLDAAYRARTAQAIVQGVLAWAALPGERPQPLPAVNRDGEYTP